MGDGGNNFANDGNFMAQFLKQQEEQQNQAAPRSEGKPKDVPPAPGRNEQTATKPKPFTLSSSQPKLAVKPALGFAFGMKKPAGGASATGASRQAKPAGAVPKTPAMSVQAMFGVDDDEDEEVPQEARHRPNKRVKPTHDASLRGPSSASAGPGRASGFSSGPPSTVLPPSDPELQRAAEKLAEFVAKNGKHFEEITRAKNKSADSTFSWLQDRSSAACKYYEAKLEEEISKLKQEPQALPAAEAPRPSVPVNSRFKESASSMGSVADMDYWMKRAREKDEERAKRAREETDTQLSAEELKRKSKHAGGTGHHMGDWIPKEELEKFMAQSRGQQAIEEFEAKHNRIDNSNVGHQMLAKMGWSEGQGLGAGNRGMVTPIQAGEVKTQPLGIGAAEVGEVKEDDDIYEQYKKRMMLGYKHRPNPLGNPRKAYY